MYPELTIYYYKLGVDLSYSGPPVGPNPPKKKSVKSLGGEGFNIKDTLHMHTAKISKSFGTGLWLFGARSWVT